MEIKRVNCDQFAGLLDREIDLEKGLNIIIGENESGKSSLVDLLYSLFFQNASMDKRRDQAFAGKYFPKTAGAVSGDVIDGTVRFATAEGVYKLAKEWDGREGRSRLTLPDGTVIREEEKINAVLAEILQYGRGVYDEMVFASQKRDRTLLRGLLSDRDADNVNEIAATIARAVMQTGGIELDAVEAELNETIRQFEGRWNFSADAPEGGRKRGIRNKWKNGTGTILTAYYEKEEILARQQEAEAAEKDVERITATLAGQKEALQTEEEKRDAFLQVRAVISEQNSNRELLETARREASAMEAAIAQWPEAEQQKTRAEELKNQYERAAKKQKYLAVSAQVREKENLEKELADIGMIESADLETLRKLPGRIRMLQAKLKGLDLVARVRELGDAGVRIVSSVTGQPVAIEDGAVRITEPVTIIIPGIAEIDLAPEGIDVEEIRQQLDEASHRQQAICAKYNVTSPEELEDLKRRADAMSTEIDSASVKISSLLQGEAWESLQQEGSALPDNLPGVQEVSGAIAALCGSNVDQFIGAKQRQIADYADAYGTLDALKMLAEQKRADVQRLEEKVSEAEEIPEAFAGIADPELYDKQLKSRLQTIKDQIEATSEDLREADQKLGEKSAEEYSEEYTAAAEAFERIKKEHARWTHIRDTFLKIKDNYKGDPMGDIEENFRRNLSLLSDGSIRMDSIREDLKASITSGKSLLSDDILSEGTKDTISLAFRLAMLKHLYPDGGCTCVFDDPFTDMDPKRTEAACRMLQEFARENQVIFMTCDGKYKELLSGNTIMI